jgi:hypothetical protein
VLIAGGGNGGLVAGLCLHRVGIEAAGFESPEELRPLGVGINLLPHAWVGGNDERGRCSRFRQELRSRHGRYLLAVPSNTATRDLAAGRLAGTGGRTEARSSHHPRAPSRSGGRLVAAAGGQQGAIGVERQGMHLLRVAVEGTPP